MVARELRTGDVMLWLDQGPAVLMGKCKVQDPMTVEDYLKQQNIVVESGWTISLLKTGEVLNVHEETLHLGEA